MDRQIIYSGQIPLETDLLNTNRNVMIGLGKLIGAILGTGGMVNGLTVSASTPSALTVSVAAGEIYSLQNVDNTAYSSLAADTTDTVMKQGISLSAVSLACAAPTTSGYSINYLIEATFAEVDGTDAVLPYYNATNPTQAYSGPDNDGTSQATVRAGTVSIQAKAGIAATTGSQVTPSVDSGYIALAVVTVAYGQTTISTSNIASVGNAVLPASVLQLVQSGASTYAADTGTANTYAVTYSPAVSSLTDGLRLRFKAKTANTGASTFSPNGLTAISIVGSAHDALQGGEIVVGGDIEVVYNSTLAKWVLLEQTGGAQQVAAATQSEHALRLGQATGRLLKTTIFGSSGTFTPQSLTTKIKVRGCGGGGAGGSVPAQSSGYCCVGSGGGSAAYFEATYTSGFSSVTVTVGAAGAANAGTQGGAGGTTTFGSLATAPGGSGGAVIQNATTLSYFLAGQGAAGATASTTGAVTSLVSGGSPGQCGQGFSGSVVSGQGASSPFGGGGNNDSSGIGSPATGLGAGGSGAATISGGSAYLGGVGSAGFVIVEEYA